MEEFRTNIFEKTTAKARRRMISNLSFLGLIALVWYLYLFGFPFARVRLGLIPTVMFSIVVAGVKLYDDKAKGISAYGERTGNLTLTDQYLEINDTRIPYSELTNLTIYVDEYLGMPKDIFGIHHGGNNKIEFERDGKFVSIQYVIKNKTDFDRVGRLVNRIENDPVLKPNLRKL